MRSESITKQLSNRASGAVTLRLCADNAGIVVWCGLKTIAVFWFELFSSREPKDFLSEPWQVEKLSGHISEEKTILHSSVIVRSQCTLQTFQLSLLILFSELNFVKRNGKWQVQSTMLGIRFVQIDSSRPSDQRFWSQESFENGQDCFELFRIWEPLLSHYRLCNTESPNVLRILYGIYGWIEFRRRSLWPIVNHWPPGRLLAYRFIRRVANTTSSQWPHLIRFYIYNLLTCRPVSGLNFDGKLLSWKDLGAASFRCVHFEKSHLTEFGCLEHF